VADANVLVLVVGSTPTGIALCAKLPPAWAYWPKHCISSCNYIDIQLEMFAKCSYCF